MARANADWHDVLLRGAAELGIEIGEGQLDGYRVHLGLLLEHRERAALTSVSDPAGLAIKHYLDSLTCLLVCEIASGERVADVGSGAGFPGLILAIARPHARYLLIEATKKRAAFLALAAGRLGLDNVTVLAGRAEEFGRGPEHRESCDLVLSRAVAPLPVLLEYGLPLTRVGGRFLALKGPAAREELDRRGPALGNLGGRVAQMHELRLPEGAGDRILILVEKIHPTPSRYPRRPGIPAKRPLE